MDESLENETVTASGGFGTARACGHIRDQSEDLAIARDLRCARHRCWRKVQCCVVYVGASSTGPKWRIEPCCKRHRPMFVSVAKRARLDGHDGITVHKPDVARILDFIHEEGRCAVTDWGLPTVEDPEDPLKPRSASLMNRGFHQ